MIALFIESSFSRLPQPPGGLTDKDEHFFFFGILALLALRALARAEWRGVRSATASGAILITALYGLSDEIHQIFVPGRDFEVLDIAADTLGASFAAVALWAWAIIKRRSSSP